MKNQTNQRVGVSIKNDVSEIRKLIERGVECWVEAGEIIVNLVDNHQRTLEDIAQECDSEMVTVEVLAQFERIGRKQVAPRLLAVHYPAGRYMERLPYSEQIRLLDGTVELFVMRDGKGDTLQVSVRDMTKEQCKQVFVKDGVRSIAAQRLYLEAAREARAVPVGDVRTTPWTVKSGRVIFRGACELTRHDLATILAQLS